MSLTIDIKDPVVTIEILESIITDIKNTISDNFLSTREVILAEIRAQKEIVKSETERLYSSLDYAAAQAYVLERLAASSLIADLNSKREAKIAERQQELNKKNYAKYEELDFEVTNLNTKICSLKNNEIVARRVDKPFNSFVVDCYNNTIRLVRQHHECKKLNDAERQIENVYAKITHEYMNQKGFSNDKLVFDIVNKLFDAHVYYDSDR